MGRQISELAQDFVHRTNWTHAQKLLVTILQSYRFCIFLILEPFRIILEMVLTEIYYVYQALDNFISSSNCLYDSLMERSKNFLTGKSLVANAALHAFL